MKQMSLSGSGFARKTKRTSKREFLDEMNLVVPWAELVALIAHHAPARSVKGGRPAFAVETMLRIHCLQQWFNLSDPTMEEALYGTPQYRMFAGLDMGEDNLPDESTILRFRHLLDQTKKGNQWHNGMKAHAGVEADSGLVHSVATTAANAHDITQAHALLHGEESNVFADSGYRGVEKRKEIQAKHRGMPKNTASLVMRFVLSGLWMARKRLLNMRGTGMCSREIGQTAELRAENSPKQPLERQKMSSAISTNNDRISVGFADHS